jgi:low temperature requirement protein LtrA
MWLSAVLVEALTPTTARYFAVQMQLQASHMAERYGLFTLIVLGGALVAVVSGTADTNWAPASALCAAPAFIATAALWWTYFDCVDMGGVNRTMLSRLGVAYAHCLMYAAMTGFAVGTLLLIGAAAHGREAGPAGALVGGGVATVLLALFAVDALAGARANRRRIGIRLVGSTAAAGLALAGGAAAPLELAALLDAVLLAGLLCESRFLTQRGGHDRAEGERDERDAHRPRRPGQPIVERARGAVERTPGHGRPANRNW